MTDRLFPSRKCVLITGTQPDCLSAFVTQFYRANSVVAASCTTIVGDDTEE